MSQNDTEKNVKDMLYHKLNTKRVLIEPVHRIGKPKDDYPRTIVNIISHKHKQLITSNVSSLTGTDFFISDDYSKETVVIRKKNGRKFLHIYESSENVQSLFMIG